jgi:hypothetical protein
VLEDRTMPAVVTWVNPNGGDWNAAANWSGNAVPTAGDDVVINVPGQVTITHSQNAADVVRSVTCSDALVVSAGLLTVGTASITATGSLTLSGGARVGSPTATFSNAGTVTVDTGSVLEVGAYTQTGGSTDVEGSLATLTPPTGALSFNGTSDTVHVGSLGARPAQGAIEFWMNAASVDNYRNILTTGPLPGFGSTGNQGIRFEENGAGILAAVIGSDSANPAVGYTVLNFNTQPLAAHTWYHVALTWDSTANTVRGFLDGEQVFSTTNTNWPTNFSDTYFGVGYSSANPSDRYWNGQIADVRFWDTALTQSQIQDGMNHALTGAEPGLIGAWALNDGSGGTAADLSPFHRNGVLQGAPAWQTVPPRAAVSLEGGSLWGTGTINADLTNSAGVVNPGTIAATGVLTVQGTYTQTSAGALDFRVGGPAAGTGFDQLDIQGAASLGGTVNASLVNDFAPDPFQTFPVVNLLSHDNSSPTTDLPPSLGVTLNATNLTLYGKVTTSATLTSNANPSSYGQAVTFTATVSAAAPGGTPTGTVEFKDGDTVLDTETLSAGGASFTTWALAVAGHAITAVYSGDSTFTTSASPALTQTVNQDATTTTLTSSANPTVFGQAVTFTATVSAAAPGGGAPSGAVTFSDGGAFLGTASLQWSNGVAQATFTTSLLGAGSHTISAAYAGDGNFTGSCSSVMTQAVSRQPTTTTAVVPSANPALYGQVATFTAHVAASTPGSGAPGGTVQFQVDGGNLGAPVSLVNGQASLTASNLSVGPHTVTAVYSGDTNFLPGSGGTPLTVIRPASLSGEVFADLDANGRVGLFDWGIAGVSVALTGVDDLGHAVNLSWKTGRDGRYLFANLRPGSYTITETQPAGYCQGIDSVGTAGGSLVATDRFFVQLGAGVEGRNYNFGERPTLVALLDEIFGVAFWQNISGPNLIPWPGGGCTGAQPGNGNLAGWSNGDLAALFQMAFRQPGQITDAQATALWGCLGNTRKNNALCDFNAGGW